MKTIKDFINKTGHTESDCASGTVMFDGKFKVLVALPIDFNGIQGGKSVN